MCPEVNSINNYQDLVQLSVNLQSVLCGRGKEKGREVVGNRLRHVYIPYRAVKKKETECLMGVHTWRPGPGLRTMRAS